MSYPTLQDGARHEQDANDWWSAASTCIRLCAQNCGSPPSAISLTGQMQCLLPVSRDGKPLRHAILHSDCRASAEATEIETLFEGGAAGLQDLAGVWTHGGAILSKLVWMARNEPSVLERAESVLVGAHSFVCLKLCGKFSDLLSMFEAMQYISSPPLYVRSCALLVLQSLVRLNLRIKS